MLTDACDTIQTTLESLGGLRKARTTAFLHTLGSLYKKPYACWLKELVASGSLTTGISTHFKEAIAAGLTLRRTVCNLSDNGDRLRNWLGERFYFGHEAHVGAHANLASLVSSQLGRGSRNVPEWPRLINCCLKQVSKDGACLLLCSGTTLFESTRHYAQVAGIPSCEIKFADKDGCFSTWLQEVISSLSSLDTRRNFLSISPPTNAIAAAPELREHPLRDRALFALANRSYCIFARSKGTVNALLERRLLDEQFAEGSTFIAITDSNADQKTNGWLSKGAVGLYTSVPPYRTSSFSPCSIRRGSQSLTAPLHEVLSRVAVQQTRGCDYLAHCTRGGQDHLPEEAVASFHLRTWIQGEAVASSAFETLSQILSSKKLIGTSRITRTGNRCVSLSAVPLLELLQRRTYRRHLGRWDWEPYGILIKQGAAEKLGARPVIYGDEECFTNLSSDQQLFFQPGGPGLLRSKQKKADWSHEMEWRVADDLNFAQLDCDELLVFTRFRAEAEQLSRISDWPVLWVSN